MRLITPSRGNPEVGDEFGQLKRHTPHPYYNDFHLMTLPPPFSIVIRCLGTNGVVYTTKALRFMFLHLSLRGDKRIRV